MSSPRIFRQFLRHHQGGASAVEFALLTPVFLLMLVGMLAYVLRGVSVAGLPVPYEVMVAASVPVTAFLVYLGTRRLRRAVTHDAGEARP